MLAEQLAYYRARAPEYTKTAFHDATARRAEAAAIRMLERFQPAGDVLELACGPGTWTGQLARHAEMVTALDGAPEMLELARAKVRDERVRLLPGARAAPGGAGLGDQCDALGRPVLLGPGNERFLEGVPVAASKDLTVRTFAARSRLALEESLRKDL